MFIKYKNDFSKNLFFIDFNSLFNHSIFLSINELINNDNILLRMRKKLIKFENNNFEINNSEICIFDDYTKHRLHIDEIINFYLFVIFDDNNFVVVNAS